MSGQGKKGKIFCSCDCVFKNIGQRWDWFWFYYWWSL